MSDGEPKDPSTCQACGKNPATLRIRRVAVGEETELFLCPACAREQGFEPKAKGEGGPTDALALLFQGLGEATGSGVACPDCGLTFARFKETGRLGCGRCYQTFHGELTPLLRRIHGSVRHGGKAPRREGKAYDHAARLRRLNEELERAVSAEDYERAAALRDQIQNGEAAEATEEGAS